MFKKREPAALLVVSCSPVVVNVLVKQK